MSRNYKFKNKDGLYFVSFATVYWIDVFVREIYFSVLIDSVNYCKQHKGLELYAYCFMPSHVHLIFRSANSDPAGLIRDFKKHTAKQVIHAIETNNRESRREWLLWMFEKAGSKNATVSKRQFWQQHNKPVELWTPAVIKQKINYIHNNPIVSGFVTNAEDWKYSSARNFQDDHTILQIDDLGLI